MAAVNRWVLYLAVAESGVSAMYLHVFNSAKYSTRRFTLGGANSHAHACWSGFEHGGWGADCIFQCTMYNIHSRSGVSGAVKVTMGAAEKNRGFVRSYPTAFGGAISLTFLGF